MRGLGLLVTSDCPNHEPGAALLRTALDEAALISAQFVTTAATTEEVNPLGFIGSPTILVHGRTRSPCRAQPALVCRIYSSPRPTSRCRGDHWDVHGRVCGHTPF